MVRKRIMLDLPNDFLILCELAGFHPEHAIQYFIDHVSFPRLLSSYPIDPNRAATGLIYLHAKRNVTNRLWASIYFRFAKGFIEEFDKIMMNEQNMEQPELEDYARRKLIEYRDLYRKHIPGYKTSGHKINQEQYER
ncbi:hypothetical protein [Parapedobacter soli]|uniref:hypothetical protein n=1 Tax=Parapedobacter soli TaxID=416955 RepID=UPI0021C8C808|nr:hypothetical protein [Parapedobacter soli]